MVMKIRENMEINRDGLEAADSSQKRLLLLFLLDGNKKQKFSPKVEENQKISANDGNAH